MEEHIEDELNYIVHQLNESMQSPDTCSLTDALCDVAYSLDLVDDREHNLSDELDVLIDGILYLGEVNLLSSSDNKFSNFRNFTVSSDIAPPALLFSHQHSKYDIAISTVPGKPNYIQTEIITKRYTITDVREITRHGE